MVLCKRKCRLLRIYITTAVIFNCPVLLVYNAIYGIKVKFRNQESVHTQSDDVHAEYKLSSLDIKKTAQTAKNSKPIQENTTSPRADNKLFKPPKLDTSPKTFMIVDINNQRESKIARSQTWHENSNSGKRRAQVISNWNKKTDLAKPLLPYNDETFSYPSDINFEKLIEDRSKGVDIGYRVINPHNFNYLHQPEKCGGPQNITLLVAVKSSVINMKLRESIRKTWGKNLSPDIVMIFLLGMSKNKIFQSSIQNEFEEYRDILQEDFIDAYSNVTYKTRMGFTWPVVHCHSAKFVFFVDDDHYVNPDSVLQYVLQLRHDRVERIFEGYLLLGSTPYRYVESKWYISPKDYPYDGWAPYLAGGAYLVSMAVAQKFVISFPYIKSINIDDSWLGIVAKKVGITPKHNVHFNHRSHIILQDVFAVHGFKNPDKVYDTYKHLKSRTKERPTNGQNTSKPNTSFNYTYQHNISSLKERFSNSNVFQSKNRHQHFFFPNKNRVKNVHHSNT